MKKGLRQTTNPVKLFVTYNRTVPNLDLMKKGLRLVAFPFKYLVGLNFSSKPRPDEEGIETQRGKNPRRPGYGLFQT